MTIEQATFVVRPNASSGRLSSLARSVTRTGARRRLLGELRSIAVDLLGTFESEELPAACAAWVDMATETAVTTICDPKPSVLP